MKKLLIMGLTLTTFALISCGKSDQKKCEEEEGKVWNEETKKCENEASVAVHTITNAIAGAVVTVVSGSNSLELAASGGCAKIKASQFATLKVSRGDKSVLCDSTDGESKTANDCSPGNYNVASNKQGGSVKVELQKADAMNDSADCKALGDTAEPAGTAPAEGAGADTADGTAPAEGAGADTADGTAPAGDGSTTTTEGEEAPAEAPATDGEATDPTN